MTRTNTRAAAARMLAAHVGEPIATAQVNVYSGRVWLPGPRILARRGATGYTLDGSTVALDTIEHVDRRTIVTTWTADGALINRTAYTLDTPTGDDVQSRPFLLDPHGVRYVAALPFDYLPHGWAQCGTCGRSWDDTASTAVTPAPGARCPFEYEHV